MSRTTLLSRLSAAGITRPELRQCITEARDTWLAETAGYHRNRWRQIRCAFGLPRHGRGGGRGLQTDHTEWLSRWGARLEPVRRQWEGMMRRRVAKILAELSGEDD